MDIVFENVSKRYPGGKVAVTGLDFTLPAGAISALLGTSGSGKTTTLKLINRLQEPTDGRIRIGGKDTMQEDPIALRRSIGYVIQGGGLFPHLTVDQNMSMVGRLLGWPRPRLEERLDLLFGLFRFDRRELAERFPGELSGGQCQRVGVARALLTDPPILLMDEPFSALDPVTRRSVQDEFLSIQRQIAKTIVIVTHDMDECFRLADRVVLMHDGRPQQVGAARELVESPANEFVRTFLESTGIRIAARVAEALDPTVESARIHAELAAGAPRLAPDDPVTHARRLILQHRAVFLPVVQADGTVIGAVTPYSLIESAAGAVGP